jgi:hypothetical protein
MPSALVLLQMLLIGAGKASSAENLKIRSLRFQI